MRHATPEPLRGAFDIMRWTPAALVLVLAACGGATTTAPSPFAETALADRQLPAVSELDAWLDDDPADAEDRLLMAFALEAAGDPDMGVAVLAEAPDWPAELEAARALRVAAFRHTAPAYEQWIEPLAASLAASPDLDDLARALWSDHAALAGYRNHRYAMAPGVFDRGVFGVPSTWRTVGPLTSFANLGLERRYPPEAAPSIPAAVELATGPVRSVLAATRSGGMRIPTTTDGVYLAETFFEVEGEGEVVVAIGTAAPFVAFVDGVEVARRAVDDAFGPQLRWSRVRLDAGSHRLLLRIANSGGATVNALLVGAGAARVLAVDAEPRSVVDGTVRVVARDGALADGFPFPEAGSPGLRWLVAADAAIASADARAARRLIEFAGEPEAAHPVVAHSLTRLSEVAFEFEPTERSERALRAAVSGAEAWDGALAARVFLVRHYLGEGQLDRAEAELSPLLSAHPESFAAQREAARLYTARGWNGLARDANRRAALAFPRHCPTIGDLLDEMIARGEPIDPDALPPDWMVCDQAIRAVVNRYHLPRGEFEQALERARLLHSRNPNSRTYALLHADLAAHVGNDEEAEQALEEYARWTTADGTALSWAADRALASGDRARADAAIAELRDRFPVELGDAMAAAWLRGEPLLDEVRRDGVQIVADYLAEAPGYEGDVVYVWDWGMTRYFDDGSAIEHVHQILQVRSRDALGAYGEVGVPNGAILLSARTIKPDGTALVPDDIAGKDSISMPALERGDFIELEWAAPTWGPTVERAAVRSDRFFFRSFDGPFHHSVARYEAPESWGAPVIDLRGQDATVSDEVRDGLRVVTVEARGTIPPAPDPRSVHGAEWMPSVRVAWNYDWDLALSAYANALAPLVTPTESIRSAVDELLEGARSDRERVRRIFRYLSDEVPDFGGFFSTPASWTWESGEGERLPLLLAMLDAAGFDADVVFVRPWDQDLSDTEIPDASVYDLTAVRVAVDGGEVWMEPDFERYPFDYLRIDAQDCEGIVVFGPRAGQTLTTPRWPDEVEENRIRVVAHFDETGDAEVTVEERLPVRVAQGLRLYLQSAEDERMVRRELESALTSTFPGIGEVELEFEGLDRPDDPITIAYRFESRGLAERDGDTITFDGEIFSRPLANWYGERAARERTMLVVMPVYETLSVRFELPDGWEVASLPESQQGETNAVRWSRSWSGRGDVAELSRQIRLPVQRVEPEDYPEFAESLARLRAGDRMRVTFRRAD